MPAREWLFALLLALAGCLVTVGVDGFHPAAAKVVAGGLLAGWAWLVCGGDG